MPQAAASPPHQPSEQPHTCPLDLCSFETTSHTLAWTLYEVASNPSVQQRIEAELATAGLLGPTARPLEFADLAQLAFLNCVLKEALRLHPVAANGTIRCAPGQGRAWGRGGPGPLAALADPRLVLRGMERAA